MTNTRRMEKALTRASNDAVEAIERADRLRAERDALNEENERLSGQALSAEIERDELQAELDALRERNEALEELANRIPDVVSYVTATLASATDDPSTDWGKVHRGRAFSSIGQLKGLAKRAYELILEENDNG